MIIILIGPPGSGKGTISEWIVNNYKNVEHIAPGDKFREHLLNKTKTGLKIQKYMDSGCLVPPAIVLDIMEKAILQSKKEIILFDGFPRNMAQAKGLEVILSKSKEKLEVVFNLVVSQKITFSRLVNRVICKECKVPYNLISKKSKVDGICDVCKGKLIKRKDDSENIINIRFNTYNNETFPLIEYYNKQNKLQNINTSDELKKLIQNIESKLNHEK